MLERVYFAYAENKPDPVIAVLVDKLDETYEGEYDCYTRDGWIESCSAQYVAENTRPATPDEYRQAWDALQANVPGFSPGYSQIKAMP